MSCRKRRRSNGNDAVNASTSGRRPRANLPRMRFFWLRRTFTIGRADQSATRESIERPQLAGASARRTNHRSVEMRDVHVHLMMEAVAVSAAGDTAHQLALCAQ